MTDIAANVPSPCPQCSTTILVLHVQRVAGPLSCSTSVACGSCGFREESDGDELDADVRAVMLHEHGEWRTVLINPGPHRLEVLRQLVEKLQLTRAAALALLRSLPAEMVRGTLPEAERVLEQLQCVGANAIVERTLHPT